MLLPSTNPKNTQTLQRSVIGMSELSAGSSLLRLLVGLFSWFAPQRWNYTQLCEKLKFNTQNNNQSAFFIPVQVVWILMFLFFLCQIAKWSILEKDFSVAGGELSKPLLYHSGEVTPFYCCCCCFSPHIETEAFCDYIQVFRQHKLVL